MAQLKDKIVLYLLQHKGKTFSASEIANGLFGDERNSVIIQNYLRELIESTAAELFYSVAREVDLTDGTEKYSIPGDFQDWLASLTVKLLERVNVSEKYESSQMDLSRKDHVLLNELIKHSGKIVTYSYLSNLLYGREDEIGKTREIFSYLKDSGQLDSADVYVVNDLGIGLGIRKFGVSFAQFEILKLLWLNPNGLTAFELYEHLYDSKKSLDRTEQLKLQSVISRTRVALSSSSCDIELVRGESSRRYVLTVRD